MVVRDGDKMRRIILLKIMTLELLLLLAGCSLNSETPPSTSQAIASTMTQTPNVTLIPSETATAAPSAPPSTPTGPPPPLPDLFPSDFLFEASTPECQLPCWQGLRPGYSSRRDFYSVLDAVFGFDGYRPPPNNVLLQELPDGLDVVSHRWQSQETGSLSFFSFAAYFNKESDKLEGLALGWSGRSRFRPYVTMQRVLRELGEPDFVFVSLKVGGLGGYSQVVMEMMIVYSTGLEFYRAEAFPVTEQSQTKDGSIQAVAANLCFGDDDPYVHSSVDLMLPLSHGLKNLSNHQQFVLGSELSRYVSITEITDMNLQQMIVLATQQDNACIRLNLERFR